MNKTGSARLHRSASSLSVTRVLSRLASLAALSLMLSPAHASLIGHWAGEGNASDTSGFGNDGVINGATFTTGVSGQAFLFDGNDNVSIPGIGTYQFGTGDFTVAFWARSDDFANNDSGIVSKDNFGSPGYNGWLFNVCGLCSGGGGIGMEVRDSVAGFDGNARVPVSGLQTGTWYHFTGVRSGTSMLLYLNGALATSIVTSGVSNVSNNGELTIGSLSAGSRQYFNGAVDDLRIYDTALSAAEVTALAVPEPATSALLFVGFAALCAVPRRMHTKLPRADAQVATNRHALGL